MTYTATNLKDDIISYGGDEVAEIGDNQDQFLIWLNLSLVNLHDALCVTFNKWFADSITFTTKGYEADIPTDWDSVSEMILYSDSDKQEPYDEWEVEFGVHRFYQEQSAGKTLYRRYRLQPNTYTAMADDILECANPRSRKPIMEEITSMYLDSQNDLESNNAGQAALSKSNRNT